MGSVELEELWAHAGVDLYISGHHHSYFPGRTDKLRLVSMGCLGSGPRALIGTDTPSVRSILRLRLDGDGIVELDAVRAPGFDSRIERKGLPSSIGKGEHRMVRDDLPWSD